MTKMDFINTICRPYITVGLDLFCLYDDHELSITHEKFSHDQMAGWRVPWYTDINGKGSEYNLPGAIPLTIKDSLGKLDHKYESHKQHHTSITYFTGLINKEELSVYDPIIPVVGYDCNDTYIIFDGNHRVAASYFIKKPTELTVMLVASKKMKNISHDLKYHP